MDVSGIGVSIGAMSDEPKYDPDRSVFEDLYLADPEVVQAYLDDPVVSSLHDDLGRMFQGMPAAEQRTVLHDELRKAEDRRREVLIALEGDHDVQARQALEMLLDGMDDSVNRVVARLRELATEQ